MDCGSSCIKYLLFIFNFIFVLCGLALLIPGILVETNLGSIDQATAESIGQIEGAAIAIIVIGSIIFVIAFFGCCGAIRESHCMVVTYAVLLLTILVIQVGIAIWAFVSLKNVEASTLTNSLKTPVNNYWRDENSRLEMDLIQETLHCCGAKGPDDWSSGSLNGSIPWSCCKVEKENKHQFCNERGKEPYSVGCGEQLSEFLKLIGKGLGGIALGIAGVELLGIIFALCLANSIRNEDRRNYRV
ncbi:23 kDa integral membrane protein isoform X2 [Diachasma alloeum]|uniref:23 kDa integral membrane protein isoform X2 n=1 Tax=Diachasma alloeum TaxID=454923 RepID=UPI0007383B95|nr:23 kDa integral membrane protein isoform X2 [Diachasma alloeum]